MLLVGGGADVNIDSEIEAAGTFEFVPNEQGDFAGGAAMNQDLRGSNNGGVGDRGVGDRDALEALGGIDEQRLVDHDAQRSRALRLSGLGRKSGLRRWGDLVLGRRAGGSARLLERGSTKGRTGNPEPQGDSRQKCRAKLHRLIPLHMRKPAMQY